MSAEKLYEFEIGERAVYPCHGVGTIEKIEASKAKIV
jgi:RNA polymerase-interacting CarD/CdnL/TRCF family regulator